MNYPRKLTISVVQSVLCPIIGLEVVGLRAYRLTEEQANILHLCMCNSFLRILHVLPVLCSAYQKYSLLVALLQRLFCLKMHLTLTRLDTMHRKRSNGASSVIEIIHTIVFYIFDNL